MTKRLFAIVLVLLLAAFGAPGDDFAERGEPAGAGRVPPVPCKPLRGFMSPSRDMTSDDFDTLSAWGVTLLRYQMTRKFNSAGGNGDLAEFDAWLESRLAHFESFVLPQCRAHGIKVVLDMHVTPGGRNAVRESRMFFNPALAAHFVALWRSIACRFRGNEDVIYGYDLVNQPLHLRRAAPGCDCWTLQNRAAEAIREVDPATTIIVESNMLDHPSAFRFLSPLALDNVIYQLHMYDPCLFTHQGVKTGGRSSPPLAYPDAGKGWDMDLLRRELATAREFQAKRGAKIYVGEFSAVAWAPGADQYLRDCIAIFEEYGWDWTYHAFREWEGWSVEHEGICHADLHPSADNPRKRALLDGFRH